MSFQNNIRALYQNFVGNRGGSISGHTYDTFPDNDDISLTCHATANTFGDYVEISADVGAEIWTVGLLLSNPSLESPANDFKVGFATGAASSETDRITIPYFKDLSATTAADVPVMYYSVPFPMHIPNGTREAAHAKSGSAAADTIDIVEVHALGLS